MTQLTLQVFDCMLGRPAPGVAVNLEQHDEMRWNSVAAGSTAADGRLPALGWRDLKRGRYRLAVGSASYFAGLGTSTHYGECVTDFQVSEPEVDLRVTIHVSPATFTAFWHHE
jgi:5-hydroxyisourate hydrolase